MLLVVELLLAPVELVDVSFKDFTGDSVLEEFISLLAPVTKCTDERSKSANGRRKSLVGAIVTTSFYSAPRLLLLLHWDGGFFFRTTAANAACGGRSTIGMRRAGAGN